MRAVGDVAVRGSGLPRSYVIFRCGPLVMDHAWNGLRFVDNILAGMPLCWPQAPHAQCCLPTALRSRSDVSKFEHVGRPSDVCRCGTSSRGKHVCNQLCRGGAPDRLLYRQHPPFLSICHRFAHKLARRVAPGDPAHMRPRTALVQPGLLSKLMSTIGGGGICIISRDCFANESRQNRGRKSRLR